MRVLVVTKIFPNAAEPLSAPFNRRQFAALAKRCEVSVLGTIPWYPGAGLFARWSSAGRLANVPDEEVIDGMHVRHPRTLFFPRMAHATWGPAYAASLAPEVLRWRGRTDVVLGSWAYPDGFAAILLAAALGVPAVVKLHGSDVNVIAKMPGPRRMMRWLLPRAAKIIAVSRALADEVERLGVAREKIAIVMNGVDGELFHPRDRAAARAALGVGDAPLFLYVGNLKPEKGIADLAAGFARARATRPDLALAVIGGGSEKIDAPGVTMHGPRPPQEVAQWMAACDALVLPSHAEGTPNVVLEALASGRRVVATQVGGIPDLITDPRLGELVPPRDPEALARALLRAATDRYDPEEVARLGARGGWDASAAALHAVLEATIRR